MSETDSKAQNEFFVTKGEQQLGPWTVDQIAERIARSEISITDFYYDQPREVWVALMELDVLKEALRKAATPSPQAPPKMPPPMMKVVPPMAPVAKEPTPAPRAAKGVETKIIQTAPVLEIDIPLIGVEEPVELGEWFVQKGANRYGPLTFFGLVRALQDKTVYDFDFVWKSGMETWVRIAEHKDFQSDNIRELASRLSAQKTESTGPFFRRQFARLPFSSEVIVHDDRSVWMGESFEAGMGGSGLLIENSALHPGQVLRLHFAPYDELPAFNALGEIVGKKFSREVRGAKTPVRYAVRFLKLDGSAESQVREYFAARTS